MALFQRYTLPAAILVLGAILGGCSKESSGVANSSSCPGLPSDERVLAAVQQMDSIQSRSGANGIVGVSCDAPIFNANGVGFVSTGTVFYSNGGGVHSYPIIHMRKGNWFLAWVGSSETWLLVPIS
jgi:hypothetical protein